MSDDAGARTEPPEGERLGIERQVKLCGRDLTVERGGRLVFAEVSFDLLPGKAILLRGPNGVGKSTLLRLVALLLRPKAGRLDWHDGSCLDDPALHASRLHYLGHADPIKPALTVSENLAFWAGPNGQDRIAEALSELGLAALRAAPGRFLSAGQKRRLALARLLVRPAPLWLLDEPAAALDADGIETLTYLLRRHLRTGGLAMISAHSEFDLADAELLRLSPPQRKAREAETW